MNKFNSIIFFTVLIIISTAWFTQNNSYLLIYKDRITDAEKLKELLYYMNNSASGFSSIQNYCLVFSLPFLLILQQLFKQFRISEISRIQYRSKVYLKELKYTFLAALLISSMHTFVNIIGSFLFFDIKLLLKTDLIQFSLLNTITLTLFYFFVGIIFCIIQHFITSHSIAMLITVFIIGILFFSSKILLPNYWTPLRELITLTKLYEGETGFFEMTNMYIKQVVILIIFYLIGSISSERKDFISES